MKNEPIPKAIPQFRLEGLDIVSLSYELPYELSYALS